ncbi:YicC family protein [Enterococcus casseliflavus]|uniref:YicC/YloC family endoribonuclease n=1 Tax=Enterococcus casseliflavus TaxID=37734 RepID=UPI002DBF4734|nr:YicC/YloC family endoribonuclease [Enterococcus casseliflavus]MEB8400821.1 YicC family protein [Enterococcus casseliflavus]
MKSMTGFGKGSAETPDVQIEIEIKSVNQRFLDLQLRMPKQLNPLEGALRQSIKQTLQRGRIELYVTLKEKTTNTKQIEIQWDLLERFMQEIDTEAKDRFDLAELPKAALLEQFLLHEAFLTISDQEPEESTLADGVMEALDQALAAIDQSRWVEGQGILQILQENQRQLQEKLAELKQFVALYEVDYQERFEKKLTAYLGEEVDRDRLLTELAILLERGDIHEELDRLSIHLTTMTELLAAETPIGRELDFLIQEMNREVNTIGSKSSPIQIKNSVVQMKTIIEKIREQVQNIE